MASLKGFLDWVKGEDMEDDYDEEYIPPRPQPAPAPAPAPVSPAPENPLSMDAQRAA